MPLVIKAKLLLRNHMFLVIKAKLLLRNHVFLVIKAKSLLLKFNVRHHDLVNHKLEI
jgi:hypothetical protein